MRRLLCVFSMFLCVQFGFSQTKLIAHKRHSGTNFHYALSNNTSDIKDSNYGDFIRPRVKNAQLDSVIFIDDEKAVMITSEFCKEEFYTKPKDSISFWRAGKDTVYNHMLFSRQHKLDSIKYVLKTQYHFKNDIDNVVFIGYDNGKKVIKKKKKEFVPPIMISTKNKSDYNKPFFLYVVTISLSFLFAIFIYLFFSRRNKQISYG